MNNQLSKSFQNTLSLDNLGDIGKDISEIAIDSFLKDGIAKDIPIIGSLVNIWKTGVAVRDYRFLKKLLLFLEKSSKLPPEKREGIIYQLEEVEFQNEAGEKLLAIIDQLESASKAKLLGKTLCLFGNKIISKEEFWRISYIIEKLPMTDIFALKDWKNIDLNHVEDIRRHLYMSVGIGWFVLNMSSTGFCWQERLCEIFEKYLID